MNSILLSALGFTVLMVAAHIFIFWWFVARKRNEEVESPEASDDQRTQEGR